MALYHVKFIKWEFAGWWGYRIGNVKDVAVPLAVVNATSDLVDKSEIKKRSKKMHNIKVYILWMDNN